MKLYDLANSPYSARVRIQIRLKDLPVAIVEPPFALRSAEFLQAFPLGKLPLLLLKDKSTIAESTVIMDYLEALFPELPLIPASPVDCAHNSMLVRYADNHLAQSLSPLFVEFMSLRNNKAGIADKLDKLQSELSKLEVLLATLPNFRNRSIQTGDICLAPIIYYALELSGWFGKEQVNHDLPAVFDWWSWINEYPAVHHTIREIDRTHKAVIKRLQGEG
ncbi:MAG: glutathione S-transferase [Porticoccaceae bacterium]|jgi:glutathione S-transferase|tara:strand:- start:1963 stop:2622 length:660 start_codon:yes stop_codon:yes gene_type:complete